MRAEDDLNSILIPMPKFPTRELWLEKYIHLGTMHKLFQGEFINSSCNSNDDPYLYYIVSGKILICFERADGSILSIAHRVKGNAFQSEYSGFASFSNDRLKNIALENSLLVSFSKKQFKELMKEDDQVIEDFMYIVHMYYATVGQRLLNTASLHASQKLLTWLDKLCKTNSPNEQGHYAIECNITQQTIADLLFIHVTTCNKLLAELEKEKIIKKTKTHLYIYDANKIEEYLEYNSKI